MIEGSYDRRDAKRFLNSLLDRTRNQLGVWIEQISQRVHVNKLTVALANKIARMAWTVITRPGTLYQRNDPRFAV